MRGAADSLFQLTDYIRRKKLSELNPPLSFHQPKWMAIEGVHATLMRIQGRLNSNAWEV